MGRSGSPAALRPARLRPAKSVQGARSTSRIDSQTCIAPDSVIDGSVSRTSAQKGWEASISKEVPLDHIIPPRRSAGAYMLCHVRARQGLRLVLIDRLRLGAHRLPNLGNLPAGSTRLCSRPRQRKTPLLTGACHALGHPELEHHLTTTVPATGRVLCASNPAQMYIRRGKQAL